MAEIGRLLTAMVTPFDDDGEINYKKARKLATALINSGSDGLVIGGTTGESPSMSNDEKIRLFAEVKEEVGERDLPAPCRREIQDPSDPQFTEVVRKFPCLEGLESPADQGGLADSATSGDCHQTRC